MCVCVYFSRPAQLLRLRPVRIPFNRKNLYLHLAEQTLISALATTAAIGMNICTHSVCELVKRQHTVPCKHVRHCSASGMSVDPSS